MPISPSFADNNDDNFFHITCHVETNLRKQIKNGEFIDLEKLLPRERFGSSSDEKRLELVLHDGMTYFSPMSDHNNKISSLRKWEQSFRIYAVIYTNKHPEQASEIWQYIYVINLAAASYQWENVYFYDVTFRHLMAMKPKCSWAKTYVQGWNLAMTDALGKPQWPAGVQSNFHNAQHKFQDGTTKRDWRDNCCWKYNKNKCRKSANDCDWDHRCTYCGGWNHSYANCRKRQC